MWSVAGKDVPMCLKGIPPFSSSVLNFSQMLES